MKMSTALKQVGGWFPFLVVVVPCLWVLDFWLRDWPLAAIAAFMSIYLVLDTWNLVRIMRATEEEPEVLNKKVPRK
jgi:hypothetical protein